MKNPALYLTLCGIMLIASCKKDVTNETPNNHELKVMLVSPSGTQRSFTATGIKAVMGCDNAIYFGSNKTVVKGTSVTSSEFISLSVRTTGCIGSPGTYNLYCEYWLNTTSNSSPIYSNLPNNYEGSITITSISDQHMDGFFNATCLWKKDRVSTDTLFISGTFKGDHLHN